MFNYYQNMSEANELLTQIMCGILAFFLLSAILALIVYAIESNFNK